MLVFDTADAERHRGEIGYMVPHDNWGRGIVSEEAHFRENFYYEGHFLDAVHFSILKRDWLKNQGIPS
jgi:RimJ/RimL family protein N-acetyltransferase